MSARFLAILNPILRPARRLWSCLSPHLATLGLAALTMLLVTGIHLVRPLILRELIDTALPRRDTGLALRLGLTFIGALTIGALALYARALLLAQVATSVMARLKEQVFTHLLGQPIAFHAGHPPGKLISRAESDIEQMRGLVSGAAAQLAANGLLCVAITAMIWFQEPAVGKWLLGGLVICGVVVALYSRFIRGIWREVRERDSEMSATLTEFLQGVSLLRLFGKEETAVQLVVEATAARATLESRGVFYDAVCFYGGTSFVAEIGCTSALLWYGTGEVFAGRLTIGTLVMFLELLRRFFAPLRELAEVLITLQGGLAATGRVFGLLDLATEERPIAIGITPPISRREEAHTLSAPNPSPVADPPVVSGEPVRSTALAGTALPKTDVLRAVLPQAAWPLAVTLITGESVIFPGTGALTCGTTVEPDRFFVSSPTAAVLAGHTGSEPLTPTESVGGRGRESIDECPREGILEGAPKRTRERFHEIAFTDVTFGYGGQTVLDRLSFTARRGERVAIVGASGSGKSTCINLLLRFYDPSVGAIRIDGRDLREIPPEAWRRRLALVQQEIHLFPGTVMDNLKAFAPDVHDGRVIAAATELGADGFIRRLPAGYATVLAERGANLSLGERQLLCYVRALVRNPELLILDEATSAVDALTERRLQEAMGRLMHGRTAVIIAHRLATIVSADRILVLERGQLVEAGTHEELVRRPGHYRHLAALQGLDTGSTARAYADRHRRSVRNRFHKRAGPPARIVPPPANGAEKGVRAA